MARHPTWPPYTKLCYNFGNIEIFELQLLCQNLDYRKPKIGNLTKVTELYHFWSQKSGICYLRGFCGDVTSHESQE